MTFDQHSVCSYRCLYCFAQYQKGIGGAKKSYVAREVGAVNVDRVKRIFTEPGYSQFWPYVKDRKTIQWGGMADPFDEHERRLGTGLKLLRFFREIAYPICFSTKGVWWLDDPRYTELFKGNKNWNVKVSIITLDPRKARVVEAGCPSPAQRLEAIRKITALDAGGATLRLRPFIFGISNPRHVELIEAAAAAGATALSTEFFCFELRSPILKRWLPVLDKLCGFDVREFYRKYSTGSGYLRLNRNIKRPFVDEMEAACRRKGVRFYVSDAHFKERCDNGSCCGLPTTFNYSRGQFCEALVLCRKNGRVTWPEVAEHLDFAQTFRWQDAEGYNTCSAERRVANWGLTMKDYLRRMWNTPTAGQSPYKMFEGIMVPDGLDEHGDIIYRYNPERA